ncbi:MAG: response regulator transcription factor [Parasporobacterium sp.]|nr:response regulator transcription factor [Parasporobacterium sp.]
MIRIAIVEDNQQEADYLIKTIERFGEEHNETFCITHFNNAVIFLDQYRPDYELIFMDIDMPLINGVEATKKLRKIDDKVVLIFVTALAQYAIQGYDVGAMDYLLKPVNYNVFKTKMTRALTAVSKNKGKQIVIRTDNKVKVIDVKNIIFIEMYNHYLNFHIDDTDEVYKMRGTLLAAKELLNDLYFEECNKGILVNLSKVSGVEGFKLILNNGEELSLSRTKKSLFMQRLAEFHGNYKLNLGRLQ